MKKKGKAFAEEFARRDWDPAYWDGTAVLGQKSKRRSAVYYELVDPSYAFSRRDETDEKLLYDNNFIPIGTCGNGDFIVVFVAKVATEFQPGAVYLLSHEYGWGEAVDNPAILPEITRLLSPTMDAFWVLAADEHSGLPIDYFDGNENPYRPPYMRKKKGWKS